VRSSLSIDVDAPAKLVFELARDVTRWPALLPHYRDVRVVERHADGSTTARMLAVRTVVPAVGYGIPVAWRARVWQEPATLGLRFRHQGGATNGMDVSWRIEPADGACHVTIEHVFDPPLPGWAAFVDGLFVRPIAGRTLATFKAIAEAAVVASSRARSSRRAPAKKSA
jgi:ribosome-associated toxin RatA of RatAB toxin-antitoxin module